MPSRKIKLQPQRGTGLRKEFFKILCELAKKDKNIIFLTGDLGYSFFEEFQNKFPKQFINCGVIEQSMVGIAAGLALSGKKPYCYSTVPFLVYRALEQIRDDICYQNLNVKFTGVSISGFIGYSHNLEGKENEEDLLKNLPNIKKYYPKTEKELKNALLKMYQSNNPAYLKL
jgi:transketolase